MQIRPFFMPKSLKPEVHLRPRANNLDSWLIGWSSVDRSLEFGRIAPSGRPGESYPQAIPKFLHKGVWSFGARAE